MKNLSLQITSPNFLDISFTTQMDLLTGKVFYHSQLGEYINMLPPTIADAIQKAVWKYIFSQKVLRIPHAIHIDYCDNHIPKQDIQPYIQYYTEDLANEVDLCWISEETRQRRIEIAKTITTDEVKKYVRKQGVSSSDLPDRERVLGKLNELMTDPNRFVLSDIRTNISGKDCGVDHVCMCIQKNGTMCGCKSQFNPFNDISISEKLQEKYRPLVGTCNLHYRLGRHTPQGYDGDYKSLHIYCCKKHGEEWIRTIYHPPADKTPLEAEEKALDEYFAQHNYHYKHGYWVKGDPREGFTLSKIGKKVKKIPYELNEVNKWETDKMHPVAGNLRVLPERHLTKMYLPKFSKKMENCDSIFVNTYDRGWRERC